MQLPFCFFRKALHSLAQPRGRILRPASLCYEMNIKRSGGPCQRYNGGQNEELAHIFYTLFVKKQSIRGVVLKFCVVL